jgi:hypothetical protein
MVGGICQRYLSLLTSSRYWDLHCPESCPGAYREGIDMGFAIARAATLERTEYPQLLLRAAVHVYEASRHSRFSKFSHSSLLSQHASHCSQHLRNGV